VRVLVAGAAGVIGGPLIKLLTAAGHEVTALTRSEAKQRPLSDAGAEPVICDVLNAQALRSACAAAHPEVVVNQLTTLPPRISPRQIGRDLAATNRLRSQGARNLMAAVAAAGAAHVVAQSVAFLTPRTTVRWVQRAVPSGASATRSMARHPAASRRR
jgi:nucleoside-diphosphate-sugar epimerase